MIRARPPRPAPTGATAGPAATPPWRAVWTLLAVWLTLGIGAWPLSLPASAGHAASPSPAVGASEASAPVADANDATVPASDADGAHGPPDRTGVGAPLPPVLHAAGGSLQAAAGAAPVDPAPAVAATRLVVPGADAAMATAARTPVLRARAQRIFGRRNLDGG